LALVNSAVLGGWLLDSAVGSATFGDRFGDIRRLFGHSAHVIFTLSTEILLESLLPFVFYSNWTNSFFFQLLFMRIMTVASLLSNLMMVESGQQTLPQGTIFPFWKFQVSGPLPGQLFDTNSQSFKNRNAIWQTIEMMHFL
jgi:hypothetical protein